MCLISHFWPIFIPLKVFFLNPDLNCFKSVLSFSVDKVTTGTYNFASVILNVAFVGALVATLVLPAVFVLISVKTQFLDQVKIKDTSQLIKGISKVFQKLLKYFNGATISLFFLIFVFPCSVFAPFSRFTFDVFPVILVLYLNDAEFVIESSL